MAFPPRRRLTVRQKRYIRRLAGYITNPLHVRWRQLVGKEQDYSIGGLPLVLPPEHNLPFYQRRDPTYDSYAVELISRLAAGGRNVGVVDVGANVGDTAIGMLSAAPSVQVVAVEGDPAFAAYLRRNLAPHEARAIVVERFVGPVGERTVYTRTGSTGGFQERGSSSDGVGEVTTWVSPGDLLDLVPPSDLTVWKSDIDGFDIHVLVEHWHVIDARCDAVWFEFDPVGTLGAAADIERLIGLIRDSARQLAIYDNLGRLMVTLPSGTAAASALTSLTSWLQQQREGFVAVPYLDIWAFSEEASHLVRVNDTRD